jgi:uncharacterized Zn-binding protein involved in type VI secretion
MPGMVRTNADAHTGHRGKPFHKTFYASGSPNVFVNNQSVVRKGDSLACGDRANSASPNVFANGIAIHRQADSTTGHGSWAPCNAETGSPNVLAN